METNEFYILAIYIIIRQLMSNYNNTLALIRSIQHDEQVGQAQQSLAELAAQDPNFLPDILSILKSQQQYNVKVSAATYVNSAICDDLFQQSHKQYAHALGSILSDPEISATYKRLLERSIVSVLDQIDEPQLTQFRELVLKLVKDDRLRDTAYLIIGCFCVPDSISPQHIVYLTRVHMMESLSRIIMPDSKDKMYLFKEYNQILKTWIVAWDKLFRQEQIDLKEKKQEKKEVKGKTKQTKAFIEETKLLLQICESQQFCMTIINIYGWMAQSPLYICTHAQLYELNVLKQQAAELHYRALQISYRKKVETKIYTATKSIINNIVHNLVVVASNKSILDKFQCRDFLITLMKVTRFFLLCNPQFLAKDWKQVLATVIFPLIRPEEEELLVFDESPSQFATYFQDCTEKQTYGSLKSEACKLLQKISDNSEQITQVLFITDFIINFCVDSIKNYLGQSSQNHYGIEFVQLDVAFTSICIFSFRLDSHQAKLSELKPLLTKQIASKMKPYERAHFYMFLGYNYGEIYTNPSDGAFWIEIALGEQQHKTSQYCANDFLFNIADQYYSDFFVQQLTNKMMTTPQSTLIDAIGKLIKTQANKISPGLMLEVLDKIYGRLSTQMVALNQMGVKETLKAAKMIQVINELAQQDEYCKQYENVRQALWKLMMAFENAVKMDLETEIYPVIESLIRQEDTISNTSKQVLVLILSEFTKDEYYEIHFYRIINQFIMKSSYEVIPAILKTIHTGIIFHQLNMGEALKKAQRRLIHSHLLLLMQNLVAMHGKSLSENDALEISSIMMRYLPMGNEERIDCPVVLARALNVMFLCHLAYPAQTILQYVIRYSGKEIYFNYDIRVLLACAKMQINKESTGPQICAQLIIMVANVIIVFRKKQKQDANSKKIKAKYGKDNRLKLTRYKEYERLLKHLDTPFKSETSLQSILIKIIEELRDGNKDKLLGMTKFISEEWTKKICELCKFLQGTLMSKRPVYSVLKPKDPQDVEREENDDEAMGNSEEQNEEQLKRKRLLIKKMKKNAEKSSKIDEQK